MFLPAFFPGFFSYRIESDWKLRSPCTCVYYSHWSKLLVCTRFLKNVFVNDLKIFVSLFIMEAINVKKCTNLFF